MQKISLLPIFSLVLVAALTSACSSETSLLVDNSGNPVTDDQGDNDPGEQNDQGGAGNTDGPDNTDSADNSGDPDNAVQNTEALSHAGKPVPQLAVNPATTPERFSAEGRDKAAALPDDIGVVYSVVENHAGDVFPANGGTSCGSLGAQYSACSLTNLHIKNASGSLDDGNWKLYFHSIRRILQTESDEFSASHVNGDLFYLEPTADFSGFNDSVKTIGLVTEFNHLYESDLLPRYWIARDSGDVLLIGNTDEDSDELQYATPIAGENRRDYPGEATILASAETRFAKNSAIQNIAESNPLNAAQLQSRIIPQPQSVALGAGSLSISEGFSFSGTALSAGSIAALTARQSTFMRTANSTPLSATIDSTLAANSYRLIVNAAGITLTGADQQALFNGAQSLLGLVKKDKNSIPYVTINDAPRFSFRGMHLDVARNFRSVDSVKSLMDQMAAYKLNKLHLHLSDDEGWRVQIQSLPELTDVGAVRKFQLDSTGRVTEIAGLMPQLGSGPNDNTQGTGFYTTAQFVDLLRYAGDRHISIIPELDMPAHARAAVVSMRARAINLGDANDTSVRLDDPADTSNYLTVQAFDDGIMNPCLPGTYNFISSVVSDIKAMYDQAGQTLDVWHMGGDEAINIFKNESAYPPGVIDTSVWDAPWEKSPACANFIQNTAEVSSREDLQGYFVTQVAQTVADAGIPALYAYHDIYDALTPEDLATQRVGVDYWGTINSGDVNTISSFSNRGYETVVAIPDFLYFDHPQEADPEERGFSWATRFTDTRKLFGFAPENLPQNAETTLKRDGRGWSATGNVGNQGFYGMQGHLWGESVRTTEQMEYMLYPRLLSLAERAWHKADWELDYQAGTTFSQSTNLVAKDVLDADYAAFAQALVLKELPKLDAAGLRYRIPVPGASNDNGVLVMNSDLPGIPLEYSRDGSNFTAYTTGVAADGVVAIRARSANRARAGRADSF